MPTWLTGLCIFYDPSLWAWMVTLIDHESWIAVCLSAHAESPEGWRNRLLSCMSGMSVFSLLYWNHSVCAASLLMCDSHCLYPSMWLPWRLDQCSTASIRCCIDPWWSLWHSRWALNSLTHSLVCQRVLFFLVFFFFFFHFFKCLFPLYHMSKISNIYCCFVSAV